MPKLRIYVPLSAMFGLLAIERAVQFERDYHGFTGETRVSAVGEYISIEGEEGALKHLQGGLELHSFRVKYE
jgi:hypothetical protein